MAEITWGSLWWRVKLLLRVWFNDARRWVLARRRARRLGKLWRAPRPFVTHANLQQLSRGAPIEVTQRQMNEAAISALLNQRGLLGSALGAGLGALESAHRQRMARAQQEQRAADAREQLLRQMMGNVRPLGAPESQQERDLRLHYELLRQQQRWGDS